MFALLILLITMLSGLYVYIEDKKTSKYPNSVITIHHYSSGYSTQK